MAVALLLFIVGGIAVWKTATSAHKWKVAGTGLGVMLIAGTIASIALLTTFPHAADPEHARARNGSISLVIAAPVAILAGAMACLIVATKERNKVASEVSS